MPWEESGGEEILHPRAQFPKPPTSAHSLVYSPPPNTATPPTAFTPLTNKTRKRTSDEFERDQIGSLVEKHQRTPSGSILDGNKEERASTRKHHSLGVGIPSRDRPRECRKDSSKSTNFVAGSGAGLSNPHAATVAQPVAPLTLPSKGNTLFACV
jgi:dual specificity tyrosine-phosphorylation-regulated kinase 2/3/4